MLAPLLMMSSATLMMLIASIPIWAEGPVIGYSTPMTTSFAWAWANPVEPSTIPIRATAARNPPNLFFCIRMIPLPS